MPFALIPFLLLVIPILEIAVFILVGNAIGLWPTLGLVVLTAVIGSVLLKQQGISTLARIQAEIGAGRVPGRDLVSGVMIAMAGVLLLTPGLVTDALGFLLFVPGVRSRIFDFLKSRVVVVGQSGGFGAGMGGQPRRGPPYSAGPDVVDLSGEEFRREPDPASPWHEPKDGDDQTNGRRLH
ncbi:FxsA family protein [Aurantimonas sp. A2-1-M11]|uniref:FxsA family protein n=1 Tax=Aurantimonas sp. A2-1-M11 TaxID=3113712 RepID=UPI002F94D2CC